MLADLERKVERRKAGFTDDFEDSRKAPISDLIAEYLDHLALKGDGKRHIADTTRLPNTVMQACSFTQLVSLAISNARNSGPPFMPVSYQHRRWLVS